MNWCIRRPGVRWIDDGSNRTTGLMLTDPIRAMLAQCEHGRAPFPPTVLFNEDWLLRLVLDWFAKSETARDEGHPLAPALGASWFSEALLPSAFLPRYKGDRL